MVKNSCRIFKVIQIILIYIILITKIDLAILSKSEIEHCYNYGSDNNNCKPRIKINLTVENGQQGNR